MHYRLRRSGPVECIAWEGVGHLVDVIKPLATDELKALGYEGRILGRCLDNPKALIQVGDVLVQYSDDHYFFLPRPLFDKMFEPI